MPQNLLCQDWKSTYGMWICWNGSLSMWVPILALSFPSTQKANAYPYRWKQYRSILNPRYPWRLLQIHLLPGQVWSKHQQSQTPQYLELPMQIIFLYLVECSYPSLLFRYSRIRFFNIFIPICYHFILFHAKVFSHILLWNFLWFYLSLMFCLLHCRCFHISYYEHSWLFSLS